MGKTAKTLTTGDVVEVLVTNDQTLKGIVLPNSDARQIVLKLGSGYNVGVLRQHIKRVISVTKQPAQSGRTSSVKIKSGLPVVSILHTGGTIASRIDYATGGVVASFTPEDLIEKFPELNQICTIKSKLLGNMLSGDLRFGHYNKIAKAIVAEVKEGVDGIIVTHGTDTMGYTAAALSFMLHGLSVPVILVGAQRSSDRGSSDAFLNVVCAARFIVGSDFGEVGICMHEGSSDDSCVILPACRTRKAHSSKRDAFVAVNSMPYARISRTGTVEILHRAYRKKEYGGSVKVMPFDEKLKIGVLKSRPNLFASDVLLFEDHDGLIIEGTGLGNMPVNSFDELTKENEKILKAVKKVAQAMPVFMVSQTHGGRVQMDVYSYGRKLQDAGVLGNHSDLLSETAYIKLAWLLSNYPRQDIPDLMTQNLKGELTMRTLYGS